MPKVSIEGKEYTIPVAVHELIQTLIIEADHFETVNKDLLKKLGSGDHMIVFGERGWSIQHPEICENKTECEIHKAVTEQLVHPPEKLGVYKVWLEEGVIKYE